MEEFQGAALERKLSALINSKDSPRTHARLEEARIVASSAMCKLGVQYGALNHDCTCSWDLEPAAQDEMLTFLDAKAREASCANCIDVAVMCKGPSYFDCWVFSANKPEWQAGAPVEAYEALPGDVCNRPGNKVGSLFIRPLLFRGEEEVTIPESELAAELSGSSDDESGMQISPAPESAPESEVSALTGALERVKVGEADEKSDFELVDRPSMLELASV